MNTKNENISDEDSWQSLKKLNLNVLKSALLDCGDNLFRTIEQMTSNFHEKLISSSETICTIKDYLGIDVESTIKYRIGYKKISKKLKLSEIGVGINKEHKDSNYLFLSIKTMIPLFKQNLDSKSNISSEGDNSLEVYWSKKFPIIFSSLPIEAVVLQQKIPRLLSCIVIDNIPNEEIFYWMKEKSLAPCKGEMTQVINLLNCQKTRSKLLIEYDEEDFEGIFYRLY